MSAWNKINSCGSAEIEERGAVKKYATTGFVVDISINLKSHGAARFDRFLIELSSIDFISLFLAGCLSVCLFSIVKGTHLAQFFCFCIAPYLSTAMMADLHFILR